MKIALLNDTHFGARNDSPAFLDYFMRFYNEIFFPYCKENNIKTVDLTGGAPEINKYFTYLIESCKKNGIHVIDRCNLTILNEKGMESLWIFSILHEEFI